MFNFYLEYEYWFAVTQLVLAMIGMGATLTVADFKDVLLEPKAATIGMVIQLVVVPVIAFITINTLGIVGGVAVGIALLAAIPGGTVSNIFTHFAKGNTALSITITSITTVACLVTTPLILGLLISRYMPESFEMPAGQIAIEIGLCLLVPLAVGMLYLRLQPNTAETFSKLCIRGSLLVIIMIVVGSLGAGRLDWKAFGLNNIVVVIGFMAAIAIINYLLSRLLGLSKADSTAIEMEVIVRNINLGLLIKASLFPAVVGQKDPVGDIVLFSLLLFGGLQLLIGAGLIAFHRNRKAD